MDGVEVEFDVSMNQVILNMPTGSHYITRVIVGFTEVGYLPHDGQRGLRDCPDESGPIAQGGHIVRVELIRCYKAGDMVIWSNVPDEAQVKHFAVMVALATKEMKDMRTEIYLESKSA